MTVFLYLVADTNFNLFFDLNRPVMLKQPIIYDRFDGYRMAWKVDFYSGVEDEILAMPPKIQAHHIQTQWEMGFLK